MRDAWSAFIASAGTTVCNPSPAKARAVERYVAARSGRGLVAHPVFKTGRAWQPHAWKVRFLRRSVAADPYFPRPSPRAAATVPRDPALGRREDRVASCGQGPRGRADADVGRHGLLPAPAGVVD